VFGISQFFITNHDFSAIMGKADRDGFANTAPGAGNQLHFSFEFFCHTIPKTVG